MATRIPASQRTREELRSLIEGRLSTGSAKDELVKLATRLIVEEVLEGEASDTIGRPPPTTVASGRCAWLPTRIRRRRNTEHLTQAPYRRQPYRPRPDWQPGQGIGT
jgi:hypothetical protein